MGEQSTSVTWIIASSEEQFLIGMLVTEYALEESEYNKSFLYSEA